ncbi:MAG: ABC transporter ATP-binding protein [Acidobacteriota bacterium]|jgi:molybdate transport system ATP-binding protein|nr:ABC transporter ATP-binding protein [Acidobacteriota bacterium]
MLDARIRKKLGGGDAPVLDVHVKAADGITVLFGPSGAGKTSILRAVAGILVPDEGRIALGETVFFDASAKVNIPIRRRRVGYVFQNHLLFPHMTAEQNALYGARGDARKSALERVRGLFAMMGISKVAARRPHELSGGEQQRVALARALATDPAIMLLDEPLSAVDAATRGRLTEEIAEIQRQAGVPFLYVTHNHTEALRLGKAMLVIDEGRVAQTGAPAEIFNAPRTASVARVVGAENIFHGRVLRHLTDEGTTVVDIGGCAVETSYNGMGIGKSVTLGIRSEDVLVSREHVTQTSARNVLRGEVVSIFRDIDRADLVVNCGVDFKVGVTPATVRNMELAEGSRVFLLVKARAVHVLA